VDYVDAHHYFHAVDVDFEFDGVDVDQPKFGYTEFLCSERKRGIKIPLLPPCPEPCSAC
jgi:hypothetical protein